MKETSYKATIVKASEELSVKDRIRKKELSGAFRIDQVMTSSDKDECVVDNLSFWAFLSIHNDAVEDKDYNNYLFETADGTQYVTGSASAWRSFSDILDELEEAGETVIGQSFVFSRRPSKTQKQGFIICNLL